MKFYICDKCLNVITFLNDSGVTPICCGESLRELKPNTVDGSIEKHVPHVTVNKDEVTVQVGKDKHPMEDSHYIKFVVLETDKMAHTIYLKPNDDPVVCFKICGCEKPLRVYEYCNIHGLWLKDLNEK